MALLTDNERARRQLERDRRAAADAARRRLNREPADADASQTVWSAGQLPLPRSASVGVPFSEGVSSVFIGAIAYLPLGLVTGYYPWNYPVAAVLVLVLSYAIWSRRVVVGPGFVAVRKFGPYRLASARSVTSGALVDSQRGGVLKLRTGDGRTMRLRRIEFTQPAVNAALRSFVLSTGRRYDQNVMQLLDLPWREDFGHHRYLLDAAQ